MTFYNTYISEYLSTFTKKNNTMKKQLIDYIYTQLMRQDLSKLPCYLKGGTMEIFLFLALYSEIKGSEEARYMASIILADTHKKELNNQPYSLLKGRLGVSWGIQYLANKNILEVDDETMKFRSIGMQDCMSYRLLATIAMSKDDLIFSSGIYMSQLRMPKDSSEEYTHNERIIILLDECERLLLHSIPLIYNPSEMPLSMLHSILYFLLQADKTGIYPFLTRKLLKYATQLYYKIINRGTLSDQYICLFLMNKSNTLLQEISDDQASIDFIANLGFYSLLYDTPQIFSSPFQLMHKNQAFTKYIKEQIQEGSLGISTLCGLGFGLLNMEGGIS